MFVADESQRDGAQSSSSYSTVPDGSGESPSQKNGNSSCSDNVKKAAQQVKALMMLCRLWIAHSCH